MAGPDHQVIPTGSTSRPPPYMCEVCEQPVLWDGWAWSHADPAPSAPPQ